MTKKYYYTNDHDNDGTIQQNADIYYVSAESKEEAMSLIRSEMLESYELEDGESLNLEIGDFGDCWIKVYDHGFAEDAGKNGVDGVEVHVARAGQHPGGNAYWITPSADIYVPVISFEAFENYPPEKRK